MRIRVLALTLAWAASLWGQSHFSWQDYCFKNPRASVCPGHEYANKPPARTKEEPPSRSVITNPSFRTQRPAGAETGRTAAPALMVVGAIDWRFADPFADALMGINVNGLSGSPLVRNLIAQLGAHQGLGQADVAKILDGLSGVDQVAFSVRDNRVVVMITGAATDSTLPAPEPGFKAVPVAGSGILMGQTEAVDQAVRRMAAKAPLAEMPLLAEQWQAGSEFWAFGSAGLIGPQAISAGVQRFSLTVSLRDRLTSDLALEFSRVPSADTLPMWQTALGAATLEGNVVHVRTSLGGDELERGFGQILAQPVGQRLAALVEAARYLPARDSAAPRQTKPVIYGLDDGPRVVGQDPSK